MEYHAKSKNSLSFDVTKDDKLVGSLYYKSWFKFNAEVLVANGSSYQVEPKGFWEATVELKEGEKVLLNFQMNWNGEIIVKTYFDDLEKGYIFKHTGFFKESFILIDQEGTELLVMKPHLNWKKVNYEYQISTSDTFEALSYEEILLMSSVHCANYYMSMMMAQ